MHCCLAPFRGWKYRSYYLFYSRDILTAQPWGSFVVQRQVSTYQIAYQGTIIINSNRITSSTVLGHWISLHSNLHPLFIHRAKNKTAPSTELLLKSSWMHDLYKDGKDRIPFDTVPEKSYFYLGAKPEEIIRKWENLHKCVSLSCLAGFVLGLIRTTLDVRSQPPFIFSPLKKYPFQFYRLFLRNIQKLW